MSKPQHTPGPWRWEKARTQRHLVQENNGHMIGLGLAIALPKVNDVPSVEANARLIAAAPELLEALKTLREDMRMLRDGDWVPDGTGDGENCSISIADSAIVKAEGK